ncbi:MAG: GTPase Era [Saccharofermentanales bacterium]
MDREDDVNNNINKPENEKFKSGYVAIIGRPNVGKSALLNKLSGMRVAIVSPKPQTTRHNIRAILDEPNAQIIFVDTPGLHKPKTKLGEYMVDCAYNALNDSDILILMIDATSPKITETEKNCCEIAQKFKKQIILIINKVDLISKEELLPIFDRYIKLYDFDTIIPISVKKNDGLDILKEEIIKRLPEGPQYFPEDSITDQTERTIVSELIREQLLLLTSDEIPHGTAVEIEAFEERYKSADEDSTDGDAETDENDQESRDFVRINAVIYCDKESHKRILIGKNGEMIKRIGSRARTQIELMLQCKVYLELYVKVREDWRNSIPILGNLGYKK